MDTRPDRNNTLTGPRLLLKVACRAVLSGVIIGTVGVAVLPKASLNRAAGGFVILFCGASVAYAGYFALAALADLGQKKPLGSKYSCRIRFGVDHFQRRSIEVPLLPRDLDCRIVSALQSIDADLRIDQAREGRFSAIRPRKGGYLASRLTVEVHGRSGGSATVFVESRLAERGAWLLKNDELALDFGRSIENVEEFQLALQRELGA